MKILIVDDIQLNRQLLEIMVTDLGYQFCLACNGKEAVESFESDKDIDLVLMDVNMPVMDGFQATRLIKKSSIHRYVPVIFVTTMDNEESLVEYLAIGGDDFISKPINEAVFAAKLNAHSRTVNFHKQLQKSNEELAYHRRLIDREHNIVEKIFKRCMGQTGRQYNNVGHYISPMSQFNGDILLIAPSPAGGIYVLLGDFTGHGLAAAIGCLPVSDVFHAMTRKKAGVGNIAREINLKLQDLLPDNMFFCASILELDQSGDRLKVWSGGMNDMLILDEEQKISRKVCAQHMPLGVLDDQEFDEQTEIINSFSGLRAYIYTDGVIEASNQEGEMFGDFRLEQVLQRKSENHIAALNLALKDFVRQNVQSDDIAIAEITGKPVVLEEISAETQLKSAKVVNNTVLPWNVQLKLQTNEIKNPNITKQVAQVLSGIQGAEQHGDILFVLINELYSNALDHGILKLDSKIKNQPGGFEQYYSLRAEKLQNLPHGEINLDIKIDPGEINKLHLRISDSGAGFDRSVINFELHDNDMAYARGISLVESLCEKLEYCNHGSTVNIVYPLQN